MPPLMIESERQSVRGHKLHTVTVLTEGGSPPVAVLCWHHGIGEHVGRYREVFQRLAEEGIAVYCCDAVGHGRSEGHRAYLKSYKQAVDEFLALCDYAAADVARRWPGTAPPPAVIAGHSMGGLIAGLACHRNQARWAGLMLCSAALDVEMNLTLRIHAALAGFLSKIMPRARLVPAVKPEDMNPDPRMIEEGLNDPLNTVGKMPVGTAHQILRGMKRLRRHWGDFTLPLYVHHGEADKCTSAPASEAFVAAAASGDKTFYLVPGGYHEVLFTPGVGPGLVDRMAAWIKGHAAGRGVAARGADVATGAGAGVASKL